MPAAPAAWSVGALVARRAERDELAVRQPDWLTDLTERVTRSVDAIETLIGRQAAAHHAAAHHVAARPDAVGTIGARPRERRKDDAEPASAPAHEHIDGHPRAIPQRRASGQARPASSGGHADALSHVLRDLERQLGGLRQGGIDLPGRLNRMPASATGHDTAIPRRRDVAGPGGSRA